MKNTVESARLLAGMARGAIIENNGNYTFIGNYRIDWDMERKVVSVEIGNYVYQGHITEIYDFINWSRERA